MATQADVRRIALALPGTVEGVDRFAFSVEHKGKWRGYVWDWKERIHPRKARVPNAKVLAVRVASLGQKEAILSSDPVKFFTEPHYNGYPAVLVRLPEVTVAELRILVEEAWRCMAPPALARGAAPSPTARRSSRTSAPQTVTKVAKQGAKERAKQVAKTVAKSVARKGAKTGATRVTTKGTTHTARTRAGTRAARDTRS